MPVSFIVIERERERLRWRERARGRGERGKKEDKRAVVKVEREAWEK
jgi:hypothetical protein